MATIEITRDRKGQFRFRVKARNGETIAVSESYVQKAKAMSTLKSLQSGAASAKVIDLSAPGADAKQPARKAARPARKVKAKPSSAKKAAVKTGGAKASARPLARPSTPKPAQAAAPAPAVSIAPPVLMPPAETRLN